MARVGGEATMTLAELHAALSAMSDMEQVMGRESPAANPAGVEPVLLKHDVPKADKSA